MSYNRMSTGEKIANYAIGTLVVSAAIAAVIGVLYLAVLAIGHARVYWYEKSGEASLAEARFSKQVAIEEAKAKSESAEYEAEAEITRAKGVAEANEIIGDSLDGKEEYLRYLYIQQLNDTNTETIYVPTEAGIPILEARNK